MLPFIGELKRWLLGFRIKHGLSPSTIFLTGGLSNMKNIHNFLSEETSIPVTPLDLFDFYHKPSFEIQNSKKNSGSMALLTALSLSSKTPCVNFLRGNYSPSSTTTLPLHSAVFIGLRTGIICLFLIAGLLVENLLLSSQDKKIEQTLRVLLQKPGINISAEQRNLIKRAPKKLLTIVKNNNQKVSEEMLVLKEAQKMNALAPLAQISRAAGVQTNTELINYTKEDGQIQAIFKASDNKLLLELKQLLTDSLIGNTNIIIDEQRNTLTLNMQD